ncbi:ATP-grasp domain-containing protein [uncultured Methanobrevibacter sp.]|uniref:ATP-grasp domain-containing protein n=1 Tax=uncultured Methanobrevibacter sp. TaxID=253161 RepID=UPI0025D0B86B|nr:ATP-grasp domain-containing protein [uncultured Methanobrevibacter sp.]
MKSIIIVDCISTGINYIGDIINRGFKPVVLELIPAGEDVEAYRKMLNSHYSQIDEKFDIIHEMDTYEETLEAVKKLDPELILPGNEHGVVLATKLSNDLGLLCNSIENLDAMTLKNKMQERLKENGLRYIRGKVISSVDEAIEFYDAENLSQVVLKPIYSAGSSGVKLCSNKDEMINSIDEIFNNKQNYYGESINELLLQERIIGDEYIVNTVSNNGIHRVTLIWKYNKVRTHDGSILYDTAETVNHLNLGEAKMVEYAYQVADAIGIEYGPVHGEFMIDDNGPILIEVNCRPCGGNMSAKFLDKIAGHHETDAILDSYLKPVRFSEKRKERYRLYGHGALKFFSVPHDIVAKSAPVINIGPKLKSYFKSTIEKNFDNAVFYRKTEDLNTVGGVVYLVNESSEILHHDLDFLRNIEKKAFELVLNDEIYEDNPIDEDALLKELESIVDYAYDYGTSLLITDQFLDNANMMQIGKDEIYDINGEFDYVIVNLNKSLVNMNQFEVIELIFYIFSDIKVGGIVFIPESTCDYIPGKRKGIEAILKTLDLIIEVPPYGINKGVIATRHS